MNSMDYDACLSQKKKGGAFGDVGFSVSGNIRCEGRASEAIRIRSDGRWFRTLAERAFRNLESACLQFVSVGHASDEKKTTGSLKKRSHFPA
jgi:hypothetical protein